MKHEDLIDAQLILICDLVFELVFIVNFINHRREGCIA